MKMIVNVSEILLWEVVNSSHFHSSDYDIVNSVILVM